MSADNAQPMSIEQRYLQLQRALFVDVLTGKEPDPTNYALTTTEEDFEVYLDSIDSDTGAKGTSSPAEDGAGLSSSGPVGDGSTELPGQGERDGVVVG